jgi:hypothetical protein
MAALGNIKANMKEPKKIFGLSFQLEVMVFALL